jgi:hypothetical protein
MKPSTADNLLHLVGELELVPSAALHETFSEAGGHALDAAAFGQALVRRELVTGFQLGWLDRELTAADAAKERVIVCGHHPLIPADMHQAWNFEESLAVLDRHSCVAAYFNGHNHAGDFVERNGIPYLTFRSMLHEPEITAFSIIDVHADRIVITGHGREESRVLKM